MKVVAKPIEVVAWFDKNGVPHPVRFKYVNEELADEVVKIDKVKHVDREKLAGNHMLIFDCQSIIRNGLRDFQIKYELLTCKWILFKI